MKILSHSKRVINSLLGKQSINSEETYRPFFYTKILNIEDGALLYNCLTFELIFLDKTEAKCLNQTEFITNETVRTLINKWFLVPKDFNDLKFVEQTENVRFRINQIYVKPKIKSFTILPTTDCNARCFYCFERNKNKKNMDKTTAYDVAKYILESKANGKIYIRWFGGEPLCNNEAIDIISNSLNSNKIEFESYMITNGYLFDDEMIERAKNVWKLKKLQITLDGTEKNYNRIKNYIYNDDASPFERVIRNIKLLLDNKINVNIRLNMDYNNSDDLYILTDDLLNRFKLYDNLKIYVCLLFEESCAHMKKLDEKSRDLLVKKKSILQNYINKNKKFDIQTSGSLESGHAGHCMADDNYSIMILPEGNLGKCQGYIDDHFLGNIYSKEINFNELNWYKRIKTISEDCNYCAFRPSCIVPKCCINVPNHCDQIERNLIEEAFFKKITLYYYNYKQKESHDNATV